MTRDVFVPGRVPVRLTSEVSELLSDLDIFARLHKVQDKDSKRLVAFDPLPMQRKIFDAVAAGSNRILIVKARQVAATTGAKMALHWLAYTTPNAAMHAIVSMREDSATALLDDSRRWLRDPPELLQRPLRTQARTRIVYDDTGASLQAFTSRSQTGLRSFQPAAVLISEAAYAPDLAETIAQADAAVGEGLLIVESTASNPADHFARLVSGAPENGWTLLSMYWWEHPAYTVEPELVPEDFLETLSEAEKQERERYDLTPGQLFWRRRTAGRLASSSKFRREYPGCLDDCFLDREGGYFEESLLADIHVVEHALHGENAGRELEAPHRSDRYVMGVDVGGGVGGDYSTLCVVSVSTRQPVYVERSNTKSPSAWSHRVVQVASRYNRALVLAESNNHGHALLLELNTCGYRQQWRSPKGKPWTTTLQSKLEAFDTLREALSIIRILDRVTWMELRSLTIPAGKIAPEAPRGAHDDCAIAIALAYRCLRDIPSSWRTTALQSGRTRIDDLISSARARRIRSSSLPF